METPKVSEKKKEPGTGGLEVVKRLDQVIAVTQKEIGILLEMESVVALGSTPDEQILEQFVTKLSDLPHFRHNRESTVAYITSLLHSENMDSAGSNPFLEKIKILQESLAKYTIDLAAMDNKYLIQKKPAEIKTEEKALLAE